MGNVKPRKRPELLLGALALLVASAALLALGISSAVSPQPSASAQTTRFVNPFEEVAAANSTTIPPVSATTPPPTNPTAGAPQATGSPQAQATGSLQAQATGPTAGGSPQAQAQTRVNLNTATQAQLETLPRIGPAKAQAILAWRAAHGPFTAVEQLLEIRGIGEKILRELLPYVALG